ncbi:MAG: NADH-quinone oxidoreductase subunit D [bacterium]|nr:NADH-quinone oxidoreductase subunit D [Candidatus Kapabacteria bacterium]
MADLVDPGVVVEPQISTLRAERKLRTEEMVLNMGPQHPSTHGVFRVELVLDGEQVIDVIPHLGYLHRCFEKHCEAMTYPQVIPYCDRMDYLGAMNNDWGYALACEQLMGVKVSEKVEYIRVIVSELNRIGSHLVGGIGTYGLDVGAFTPFLYCFRDREIILDIYERLCGARLLYNYIWIGGLSHDIYPTFLDDVEDVLVQLRKTLNEVNELLTGNKIFTTRTKGIGIMPADVAINYGITGPMLRACGVRWDIRRDDQYSIYDRFDFEVPIGTNNDGAVLGDCYNRYWVRVREIEESIRIVEQAVQHCRASPSLMRGDVQKDVPKRVKAGAGEIYSRTETSKGELGYYIISTGGTNPYRVKVRPPCFVNLSILPETSRGYMVADLIAVMGSFDFVMGEVDR